MNFTFEPKITKGYLLSKYSEETYMEYYLGIKVKKGLFRSPLRQDNTPTCSFYRNKSGELIFHDFSGDFYGNFINVVMRKYNVGYYKAIEIIAKDFGFIEGSEDVEIIIPKSKTKIEKSEPANIQVEIKEFTKKELSWWKEYGITKEILNKFHVYSCKNIFLNGELVNTNNNNLIFGYYGGKKDKLELWRIYFPGRKTYRFLTNWPSKKIQGYNQLPKDGKLLVITKSMKDCMTLYSLGIPAIAPNSEHIFINDNMLNELKTRFKYIVVMYDNDLPGISNMNKIKRKHPELIYYFIPRKYDVKDISDFYKKYKKKKTISFIKEVITEFKNYENLCNN